MNPLPDSKNIPDTLYHYCGVAAFHGIITGKEIWLSDASSVNDYMEYRWLIDKAIKRIAELERKSLVKDIKNLH